MKAKVIHTEIRKDGIIHVVDHELPPGKVNIIILYNDSELLQPSISNVKNLPLGGYKAGWISPEDLRREAIYEEN